MSDTQRVYECTYIVTPELDQAGYNDIKAKFDGLITDNGGKISHEEIWGMKKLAYPMEGKANGFYVFQEVEASNPELVGKLEQEFTYDERVLRFLTVKLDKFAREYNNKRKTKVKQPANA